MHKIIKESGLTFLTTHYSEFHVQMGVGNYLTSLDLTVKFKYVLSSIFFQFTPSTTHICCKYENINYVASVLYSNIHLYVLVE